MNSEQLTAEKVIEAAQALGGAWVYHSVMSNKNKRNQHFLTNRAGLFIEVFSAYNEGLTQWQLCYSHPKHSNLINVNQIGCSIKKGAFVIARDLNNRLLTASGEAYQALRKATEQHQRDIALLERDKYIIAALRQVLNLREYYDHRFNQAYFLEDENGNTIGRLKKWKGDEDFRISIDSVSPEKVIQIMQIIKG